MTNHHPVVPPPELICKWATWRNAVSEESFWRRIATEAAQWGADVELVACCEWLQSQGHEHEHAELYSFRRPKPPSLKEQALADFNWLIGRTVGNPKADARSKRILQALEALPDD